MEEITKADILETIKALRAAGKRFKRRAVDEADEKALLAEDVNFFCKVFLPLKVERDRWLEAEHIAILMTKAPGDLDLNVISPAIMAEALNQLDRNKRELSREEQEMLAGFVNKAREAEERYVPKNPDGKYLWDWTRRRMAMGLRFDMPSEDEVSQKKLFLQHRVGLTRQQLEGRRALIKTVIVDDKYCAGCNGKDCYMNHKRPILIHTPGKGMDIDYVKCKFGC